MCPSSTSRVVFSPSRLPLVIPTWEVKISIPTCLSTSRRSSSARPRKVSSDIVLVVVSQCFVSGVGGRYLPHGQVHLPNVSHDCPRCSRVLFLSASRQDARSRHNPRAHARLNNF